MAISVKISEENYRMLCSLSGRLQEKFGKPVSINEAISYLEKGGKLSDLAGSWKISEREVNEMNQSLKRGWKKWAKESA